MKAMGKFKSVCVVYHCLIIVVLHHPNFSWALGQPDKSKPDVYDFIVVGAGTAGSVVSGRIAASGIYSVLLIEAGNEPDAEWSVPALSLEMLKRGESGSLRVYKCAPQRNAALGDNGTMHYVAGCGLGGSSITNGMMFNRGSAHDYNKWARDVYDDNWGYAKMLPFFKKVENYTGEFKSDQHGYDGRITVSSGQYKAGVETWLKSGMELGYSIHDPNTQKISFAPVEYSQDEGHQENAYDNYVQPVLDSHARKNLHILPSTEVTKIIFQGKRAVGVEYITRSKGQTYSGQARVNKEVVISAGAIGSPLLLIKSGLGSRPDLNAAKIQPLRYLSGVGRNLQNHAYVGVPIIMNSSLAEVLDSEKDLNPTSWKLYTRTGTGPFASFGGIAGQSFLASSKVASRLKSGMADGWSDIQLIFMKSSSTPLTPAYSKYLEDLKKDELKEGESVVSILVTASRPQSRGSVKLDVDNPDKSPLIDFRFFTHPSDMQVTLDGIKHVSKIVKTSAFRTLGARLPRTALKACNDFEVNSDEYWRCFMKQATFPASHACGTAKMGSRNGDHQAVVDTQLRVMSVLGLRVADASIMPSIVNTNVQATVYAIGEKAADMILNTWKTSLNAINGKEAAANEFTQEFKARYRVKA